MRRDDLRFVRNLKIIKLPRSMLHGLPIRLTAHNNADERLGGRSHTQCLYSATPRRRVANWNAKSALQAGLGR